MAPVYAWPLMMIGYSITVYVLTRTVEWRWSGVYTFVFFFGYFLTSLYWVSSSLFVDFDKWWWALPFSFIGLPILLALFPTLCIIVASLIPKIQGQLRSFIIIFALILADIARGYLFTGFPWNLPAHTWAHTDSIMTALPSIGFWGLNSLTVIMMCLPAILLSRLKISIYALALCGIVYFPMQPQTTSLEGARISLIQANIPQKEKWNPKHVWRNLERYISMSKLALKDNNSTIIIWPETAISQNMLYVPEINEILRNFLLSLPKDGILITGYLNYDGDKPLNSIAVFNSDGEIIAQYDKHHLVPFGEYMPFGLETITGFYNFSEGQGPELINIPNNNITFLPAICYESIFPRYFNTTTESSIILNLTNDSWFGDTAGPYQHFDHLLLRAAETQTPAIRLSGNGVSGFIDRKGRPYKLSYLNDQAIISNNQ